MINNSLKKKVYIKIENQYQIFITFTFQILVLSMYNHI